MPGSVSFFESLFGGARSATASSSESNLPPREDSVPGEDVESEIFVSLQEVVRIVRCDT